MGIVNHLPLRIVSNDGGSAQAFENSDLNFLGPESDQSIKALSERFQGFAG